jgi:hypothetical protein
MTEEYTESRSISLFHLKSECPLPPTAELFLKEFVTCNMHRIDTLTYDASEGLVLLTAVWSYVTK